MKLKIFLSMPFEGRDEEEFKEAFELEETLLKDMFRGYDITIYPRRRGVDSKTVIQQSDICAMGKSWIYIPACEGDRKYAVMLGKPIVITDAEYTPKFIKDYIVGKVIKNNI